MNRKILVGLVAIALVVATVALATRKRPCNDNLLQNELYCTMIGETK